MITLWPFLLGLAMKNISEMPTSASLQLALDAQSEVVARLRKNLGSDETVKDLLRAAEDTFDRIEAALYELRETGEIA
jgi:hypothetical protein